jgi:magnesium chelatase family protein
LRDRVDIHLEVPALPFAEMARNVPEESSIAVRGRVCRARETQRERQRGEREGGALSGAPASWNAALGPAQVRRWCQVDPAGGRLLEDATGRLSLSPRGVHRVLKVARTIADLDGSVGLRQEHLGEAVQYRELGG